MILPYLVNAARMERSVFSRLSFGRLRMTGSTIHPSPVGMSRVKEIAWDTRAPCRLKTFSLRDEFVHVYGSHGDLLKAHGLDPELIYGEVCALAGI